MSVFIPLFPLGLVVFPEEHLKLHIFEMRYRQLTHECIEEAKTFGISPVIEGAMPGLGTEMRIVSIDKTYPSGEMDITTQGVGIFKVERFFQEAPGKMYPGGRVVMLEDVPASDPVLQQAVLQLLMQFDEVLGIHRTYVDQFTEISSWRIAHYVGLNIRQEYEMIGLPGEKDRLRYLRDHLEQVIPVAIETERAKSRAKLNGHFKNVLPPNY